MLFKKKEKQEELSVSEVFGDKGYFETEKKAEAISKSKIIGRGLLLTATILILIMAVLYVLSLINTGYGSFTIRIGDKKALQAEKQLSLSETRGFSNATVNLQGMPIDNMDNITYSWLDINDITSVDGNNNGENYIAYSFYIKNTGVEELIYSSSLNILKITRNLDEAVRVVVRKNDDIKIYAKKAQDGNRERYPEDVENFASEDRVMYEPENILAPNKADRYSVVIWLEGEDPECDDDVLRGILQLDFEFNIEE